MQKTYKYTLYVGHNVNGVDVINQHMVKIILDLYKVEGYTLIECTGVWKKEPEHTTIVVIIGITEGKARKVRFALKTSLMQEEVLMTKEEVEVL